MSFGNKRQTNNNEEKACNTKGIQFYNIEGIEPSTMVMSYWNQNLAIKIHPALPENKRTENSKYDYEVFAGAYLNINKAKVLLKAIFEYFIPENQKNPNSDVSYAVPTGAGMIEISNGIKFGKKNSIIIAIYDKVDSETEKCEDYILFEFLTTKIKSNYSKDSGKSKEIEIDGEFSVFTDYLVNFVAAMTYAYAHAERNVNKYSYEKQTENMKSIMTALGIRADDDEGKSNKKESYFASKRQNDNVTQFSPRETTNRNDDSKVMTTDDIDAIERELAGA